MKNENKVRTTYRLRYTLTVNLNHLNTIIKKLSAFKVNNSKDEKNRDKGEKIETTKLVHDLVINSKVMISYDTFARIWDDFYNKWSGVKPQSIRKLRYQR